MNNKHLLSLFSTICFVTLSLCSAYAGVTGSKHDFSPSGKPNPYSGDYQVDGVEITQVCAFCHTPHGGSTYNSHPKHSLGGSGSEYNSQVLWNRNYPISDLSYTFANPSGSAGPGFKLYTSPTMSVSITQQPTGTSLMCLSCHDGVTSIAVGTSTLLNSPGQGTIKEIIRANGGEHQIGLSYNGPEGFIGWGANIGNGVFVAGAWNGAQLDLSNDHPVSFDWPAVSNPGIKASAPGSLRLFGATTPRMECSTCHNVHDNTIPPFLRISNDNSDMCLQCHDK